jgi:hypothetical protein
MGHTGGVQRNPNVRAGDADRELVADALRRHYADGRLEPAEFHERLDAIYAARTYGELDATIADLPGSDEAIERAAEADRYRNLPVPPSSTHSAVRHPVRDFDVSAEALGDLAAWAGVSAVSWVVWVLLFITDVGGFDYLWPLWVTVLGGAVVAARALWRRMEGGEAG